MRSMRMRLPSRSAQIKPTSRSGSAAFLTVASALGGIIKLDEESRTASMRLLFQFPPDIGPEFLDHRRNRVVAHLRSPHTGRILQGAVTGRVHGAAGRIDQGAAWMV